MIDTKIEPPEIVDYRNVMFWEPKSQELLELKKNGDKKSATLLTKSKKFIEFQCVEDSGFNKWIIKPIPKYNKTTYHVELLKNNTFKCNCQGFSRYGGFCSHILAVQQFIFIGNYDRRKLQYAS